MYMMRIVSEIVLRNVVMQVILNTLARKRCDVG